MKCTKCNIEMTKGIMMAQGQKWMKSDKKRGGFFDKINPGEPLVAWKCEACNKVELTIEPAT